MSISVFHLFSIGVGPSSSHTMGPMRACYAALETLRAQHTLQKVKTLQVELYGSLALTGIGHGTDFAILMGLLGEKPESIDPSTVPKKVSQIKTSQQLMLGGEHPIAFDITKNLSFHIDKVLPHHSNGMKIHAYDEKGKSFFSETYYSTGGGFITTEANFHLPNQGTDLPYPFNSAKELVSLCEKHNLNIATLMRENEHVWRNDQTINSDLDAIIDVMFLAIDNGLKTEGILPGGLDIKRRAPTLYQTLKTRESIQKDPTAMIDWLSTYAIAVNEENAAHGRVVTAPTNGAAGVIPAVMRFYFDFYPDFTRDQLRDFLLVAGAIAILYKHGASLSAAEVGCQGEIGVAASMAAGALTAVLGGTLGQITNAAEIAMEHHLGMTCDPIKGLVQIPCIERNAMGAVKAVNASHLALMGDGHHYVSLDKVIATMKRTGHDMMTNYKETSLGGLAVNIPEC
jgi:L-serine dehydratase